MATVYNSQLDAFSLHHKVREQSSSSSAILGDSAIESLGHALSGSIGASISNVVTYPLDLIITRLQIQRQLQKEGDANKANQYKGVQDAIKRVYHEEGGIWGFYQGVGQDTVKTIADSFLFFLLYSFFRERRLRRLGDGAKSLAAIEELSVGFVAGALTKAATTPIANVVTRKQVSAMTSSGEKGSGPTTNDIIQQIRNEKGIAGFWSGYSASLILTLNPSLTFFLFETLKKLTIPRSKREQPPAVMTFLLSASSKAIASSVTYPFSLAKSRLQAGGKKEQKEESEEVEKDVKGGKARKEAVKDTIISTLLTIVEKEGWTSLYEGLPAEVVKGFFSHGITMLVKQGVQQLLTKLYYILSIILRRYQRRVSGKRMRERARENVEYYNLGMARAAEKIEEGLASVKGKANEVAELVGEYVPEDGEEWKELYGVTGLSKWLDGRRKD